VFHIGQLPIAGMRTGDKKDSSGSKEETMNVELRQVLLQVFQKCIDPMN
jgi:hypothetical protein